MREVQAALEALEFEIHGLPIEQVHQALALASTRLGELRDEYVRKVWSDEPIDLVPTGQEGGR